MALCQEALTIMYVGLFWALNRSNPSTVCVFYAHANIAVTEQVIGYVWYHGCLYIRTYTSFQLFVPCFTDSECPRDIGYVLITPHVPYYILAATLWRIVVRHQSIIWEPRIVLHQVIYMCPVSGGAQCCRNQRCSRCRSITSQYRLRVRYGVRTPCH